MTLPVLGLILALRGTTAQTGAVRLKAPAAEGLVIATADPAVVKRAYRYEWRNPGADLQALFPAPRFDVLPWKPGSFVVLDRASGPLGKIADEITLSRALATKADATGTLSVADLSPSEYASALAVFGGRWPSAKASDLNPPPPAALGLDVMYGVSLVSGGRTQKFRLGTFDKRQEAMKKAIRTRSGTTPPSAAASAEAASSSRLPRNEITFLLYVRDQDKDEAMERVTAVLRETKARLRRESDAATAKMLEKLGYPNVSSADLASDPRQMPESLRWELEQQLRIDWKEMGFGSSEEALAFLKDADRFAVRTSLALRLTTDPGNPAGGSLSVDTGSEFKVLPGLYTP